MVDFFNQVKLNQNNWGYVEGWNLQKPKCNLKISVNIQEFHANSQMSLFMNSNSCFMIKCQKSSFH